jgi:hypothetical protein
MRPAEISAQMHVSRETVKTYFRRMIDKLTLEGQQGLVTFAKEQMPHRAPKISSFITPGMPTALQSDGTSR